MIISRYRTRRPVFETAKLIKTQEGKLDNQKLLLNFKCVSVREKPEEHLPLRRIPLVKITKKMSVSPRHGHLLYARLVELVKTPPFQGRRSRVQFPPRVPNSIQRRKPNTAAADRTTLLNNGMRAKHAKSPFS